MKTWTRNIYNREWEVHPATPAYDGETGLFHMPTAYTLPKGRFSFQLFRDNLDRDSKDEDISIHGVSLGFGISSRFELYGNFGLQNRLDADALFQPGRVNDYPFVATPWETGVGDLKIGAKFKFLDDYQHDDPVALAVRAFVKIPTADENKGLGTGKVSWGGDLMLSKGVGQVLDLHGSIGFQVNGDPTTPVPVDLANAFKWAVGLNVPACSWIQLQAELMGTRYTGGSDGTILRTGTGSNNTFDPNSNPRTNAFGIGPQTNPLDLVVGPVIWIHGFFIRPAISWNLNFDDRGLNSSSKSWTGRHISIGYHPGWGCREIAVPPPPPPPPPANRAPTVSCEIERTVILPGESVRVRATASDPDGDPLTYEWSASAARVTGTGATATFDSTGMTPPASATITVRVSDGRGGTASSDCPVRMNAPERPRPEAVTCVVDKFVSNTARLINLDAAKWCLDDIGRRLKSDLRARAVVVGHADKGETQPDFWARKRAEFARDYLRTQHGVEESRINARSAAATKPVDAGDTPVGRARNRRVELIFLPEGTFAPEAGVVLPIAGTNRVLAYEDFTGADMSCKKKSILSTVAAAVGTTGGQCTAVGRPRFRDNTEVLEISCDVGSSRIRPLAEHYYVLSLWVEAHTLSFEDYDLVGVGYSYQSEGGERWIDPREKRALPPARLLVAIEGVKRVCGAR